MIGASYYAGDMVYISREDVKKTCSFEYAQLDYFLREHNLTIKDLTDLEGYDIPSRYPDEEDFFKLEKESEYLLNELIRAFKEKTGLTLGTLDIAGEVLDEDGELPEEEGYFVIEGALGWTEEGNKLKSKCHSVRQIHYVERDE